MEMIFSAICISEKIISAVTVGCIATIRHDVSPFTPLSSTVSLRSADSMSSAVVPGAKLLASTTYGPALPLILKPGPVARGCEGTIWACCESIAVAILLVRAL